MSASGPSGPLVFIWPKIKTTCLQIQGLKVKIFEDFSPREAYTCIDMTKVRLFKGMKKCLNQL